MLVISSRISGWRVPVSITWPKMIPMPTPAPTAPRPPPIPIPSPAPTPEDAANERMCVSTSAQLLVCLVMSHRAADVDGGEGREDESLEGCHQSQLEQVHRDPEREREPAEEGQSEDHGQAAGHEQDDQVSGEDVGEQSHGQRQQPHEGGDDL